MPHSREVAGPPSEPPVTDRPRHSLLPSVDEELPRLSQTAKVAASTARGRRVALGVLLGLSFLAVARLAAPLWVGLASGTMVAFVMQPSYRRLTRRLGDRRTLAAALTTVGTGVITTVAGGVSLYVLSRELFAFVGWVQARIGTAKPEDIFGDGGMAVLKKMGIDRTQILARMSSELERAAGYATEAAGVVVSATTSALLGLMIALMTMYYVLLEWPRIPVHLERVLPLDPRHTRALVLEFRDVGRAAVIGTIGAAFVQGVLAGAGFAMVGVPRYITWGIITALASFLPVVGTMLVWTPIGLYLVFTGHPVAGVFLLGWGMFMVVGLVDYVVRPRLVRGHGSTNPLLMLVALLGGIEVFGLAGVLVGPVIMSLFLAIMRIYERDTATPITD
ncbi:MAG: AI-2E family transporter [Polyangiales bacterium]